jgi:hypothetical protein
MEVKRQQQLLQTAQQMEIPRQQQPWRQLPVQKWLQLDQPPFLIVASLR